MSLRQIESSAVRRSFATLILPTLLRKRFRPARLLLKVSDSAGSKQYKQHQSSTTSNFARPFRELPSANRAHRPWPLSVTTKSYELWYSSAACQVPNNIIILRKLRLIGCIIIIKNEEERGRSDLQLNCESLSLVVPLNFSFVLLTQMWAIISRVLLLIT